ncbi:MULTISPECIES: DUF305 domain-containing protein [Nocardia]|uniref:DUF305 domain-containing protein n=1 Tax=Nocardia TaxID=1817 RepID=UPI0009ECE9EB|nr:MULTISPECIES: DUF305 domain-containing protein [Nocardia]MCC3316768.1 DUF305 domain-containing protein [Nocardia africana]
MHARSLVFRWTVAGLAAASVVVVAGCSDRSGTGSTTTATTMPTTSMSGMAQSSSRQAPTRTDFNDADVTFLQEMYPHHAQAVQMADLAPARTQNQQILQLATEIKNAQQPEMTQIRSLLQQFGKPGPSADTGGMQDMPGMPNMPGMMSTQQMQDLQSKSGSDFDRTFLSMMIEHHTGAINMAKTEQAQGVNPDARKLADSVVTSQQAEIDRMKAMLGQR